MNIFNFFKKKKKQEKNKLETIDYTDLKSILLEKEKNLKNKQKELILEIIEKKKIFSHALNEKINILEKLDLENVKEHPKIKHLVLLNRDLYIKDIHRLLSNINFDENTSFDEFIKKIEKSFIEFKQNSDIKYRKSTHLIGKEIAIVNDSINQFFKEYHLKIENNKNLAINQNIISIIKEKMILISNYENDLKEINHLIKSDNSNKTDQTKKLKNLENEIEQIKSSKEYLSNIENMNSEKELNHKLRLEIDSLKQLIDFKQLSKTFHGIKKYESLIEDFKDDFNKNYRFDKGIKFSEILIEAKIENNKINDKILFCNNLIDQIEKIKKTIIEDKTFSINHEIIQIQNNLIQLKEENGKNIKRLEKVKNEKNQTYHDIKQELEKLNISLI